VYAAGWDGDTDHAASKNAIYDQIQAILALIATFTLGIKSDTIQIANDPVRSLGSPGAWGKIKEVQVKHILDSARIKFELKTDNGSAYVRARIYVNGVSVTSYVETYSTTYVSQELDIDQAISCDQLIQIYVYCDTGAVASVQNMKICWDNYVLQDP
jgi:hypothetical protein